MPSSKNSRSGSTVNKFPKLRLKLNKIGAPPTLDNFSTHNPIDLRKSCSDADSLAASYDGGYAASLLSEFYSESNLQGARGFDTAMSVRQCNSLPRNRAINMRGEIKSLSRSGKKKKGAGGSKGAEMPLVRAPKRGTVGRMGTKYISSFDLTA